MDAARVVLITNVGQGFGRAIALAFAEAGHDVVCADRDVEQASKTAAEIEEHGGSAIPVQADMTAQIDVVSTFRKIEEIFGELDGIVHVAAYTSSNSFEKLAENEFGELLEENLRSTYLLARTLLRQPERRSWLIVVAPPRNAVQPQMAAVRGALTSLNEALNRQYSRQLRTNLVVPGRAASDPRHDAPLADAVLFLGEQDGYGVRGQHLEVELPPPPRITESLLPEVRAALDATVRQDDLEASHYDDEPVGGSDDEGAPDDYVPEADPAEDGHGHDAASFLEDPLEFDEFIDDWEQGFLLGSRRSPYRDS